MKLAALVIVFVSLALFLAGCLGIAWYDWDDDDNWFW